MIVRLARYVHVHVHVHVRVHVHVCVHVCVHVHVHVCMCMCIHVRLRTAIHSSAAISNEHCITASMFLEEVQTTSDASDQNVENYPFCTITHLRIIHFEELPI